MRQVGRLGWALAAVVLGAWLALVEVFWLPLRVGGVLVPLSIVVAVVGNLLLPAAALRWSGSRLVAVLPAVAWLVIAVGAMVRRPEGDLVMTGGGTTGVVNLAFLMIGVLAAAFSVGRVLAGPRRGATAVSPGTAPAPDPAGSGTGGAR
ncbi:hypothetical protein [Blastococcus litoris]|uniref:hypothetical protein n=1 Tax=Blastococcus litoris TaxID=2171622 RepID=UPI001F12E151|nr:hypothetical protein [Blastococcus litoris]